MVCSTLTTFHNAEIFQQLLAGLDWIKFKPHTADLGDTPTFLLVPPAGRSFDSKGLTCLQNTLQST